MLKPRKLRRNLICVGNMNMERTGVTEIRDANLDMVLGPAA